MSTPLPALVVKAAKLAREPERAVLSADIQADGLSMPASIWFEVAPRFGDGLAANGDPFLPPILMRAMREGRQVVVEDSLSALLAATMPRVMDMQASWSRDAPVSLRPVPLAVSPTSRTERGPAAAAFFSGGVDSFYTLLRNRARYPRSDSRAISHLIVIHGLDVKLDDTTLFGQVEATAEAVAKAVGAHVVTVRTNVRQVVSGVDWNLHAHGATLASVALALSRLFHTVFLGSSLPFLELRPWGSHPGLDPLWSTESLEIVHDGAEANRADKIEYLAGSPLALNYLRVCWRNSEGAYNCGRCEKCLRTMVVLELAGVLDQAKTFPPRVPPAHVRALAIPPEFARRWYPALERSRRSEHHRELMEAIEHAIDRGRRAAEARGTLEAAIWRYLKYVGVTPAHIKAADRRLLGGALTAFRRALRHG
ncbi:MAG: hypothetical protein GEU99_08545 [Luteitalea sp.]|nr:hypothetical protein [Luteitalea sp.]